MQAQRSGENVDLVAEVLFEGADECLGSAGLDAAHPADVPGESSTVEEFGQSTLQRQIGVPVHQLFGDVDNWL